MLGLLVVLALLAIVTVLSVMVGSRDLPLSTVWDALTGADTGRDAQVVTTLRIPRTVMGLLVGAALGVAGALVTTVVVYLIGSIGRGSVSPAQLTLAGVALGAVLSGITSALLLADQETFSVIRAWEAGSFADRGGEVISATAPFLVVGLVIALALGPALNAVALGDDLAHALGAKVLRTRVLSLLAITLLAGSATAMAGPVAFVGLMIPHIARWIVGPDQRWIIAYSVLLAPVLTIAADVLGRVILPTGEMQVGIVTAFLGAPVLVLLVRRERVSGL